MIRPATILLRLLLGAGATAMAAEAAPPQPVFERIDSRDGLAHNSVGAILQDRRGFVWIGTFAGLNRYDGVEFVVWRHDPKDPASLSSNDINGLLEDRAGNLWVGTGRGLDRMERGGWGRQRFRRYAARGPDGERVPSPIRTLFEDRAGSIWAGMPTGLLRYLETDDRVEWLRHDPLDPHSLAEGSVYSIRQDAAGMLWVLTASAPENRDVPTVLHRLTADGSGFDRFVAPDGWQATALLIDRSGRFWLNVAGLGTFDPASGRFHRPILERNDVAFGDLVQDQAGALWVSTLSGFLCFRPDAGEVSGPWPKVAAEDRLAAYAGLLIEDREERLWIGSRGGLFKWDRQRKPFRHIARRPGDRGSLSSDRISAVLEDRSGNLWLGTYGAGLNRLSSENAVANRYRHNPDDPTSLCHDTVWHLAEDPAGGFWLGVDDGLCRFDPATGHFHRALEASAVGAGEGSVRFIVPAEDGVLWLATEGGLLSLDPASGEVRRHGSEPPDGPGHRLMHSLHLDDRGSLWLGTQGGGLEQLDLASGNLVRHRLVTAAGRELRNEAIYSFWPGADGTLWLGSGEGLSHYSPATGELQHLTTHDGLPGPSVFGILGDHEGRLWLGTNQGLSRFDPGQSPGRQFLNFDLVDGIGNLEFNRHATARTVDGRFLFGGMSGLTAFRPEEIVEDSVVPEVALTRVRVGTRGGESIFHPTIDDALVLEPRQSSVAFEFAALDFTNSARTRYAYQLQGFDDGWIDNGAQRMARYHRLPPGRYRFRVMALGSDGLGKEGDSLAIRILPPFWQTWWFRLAGLLVALAGLMAAHRLRVARLLELERLRTRIAGDLHDDLSSELSGIALAMEVLQHLRPEEQRPRLEQVRQRSLLMLERLRDIVWCVNPEHDNQEALVRRLRQVAETLLVDRPYRFETRLVGSGEIPLALRRHLLLVFKEALHNAVRHADAQRIDIRLTSNAGKLCLSVVDDGIGFDIDTATGGYGLASLRRRAAEMGATFRLTSRPGAGTALRLEAPLQRWRRR